MSIEAYIVVGVCMGVALLLTRIFFAIFSVKSEEEIEKLLEVRLSAAEYANAERAAAFAHAQRVLDHQIVSSIMTRQMCELVARERANIEGRPRTPKPTTPPPSQSVRRPVASCIGCGAQVITERCEYCGRYR
jgi:hypothetical protein